MASQEIWIQYSAMVDPTLLISGVTVDLQIPKLHAPVVPTAVMRMVVWITSQSYIWKIVHFFIHETENQHHICTQSHIHILHMSIQQHIHDSTLIWRKVNDIKWHSWAMKRMLSVLCIRSCIRPYIHVYIGMCVVYSQMTQSLVVPYYHFVFLNVYSDLYIVTFLPIELCHVIVY